MIEDLLAAIRLPRRFATYGPQPLDAIRVWSWLRQFQPHERRLLVRLAYSVKYVSRDELLTGLRHENDRLIKRLNYAGVPNENIIYVQFDDAGSSSSVTLNLLRDGALLERMGFNWMDYRRAKDFYDLTSRLEEGAIVYVDDFIGSGRQFTRCHKFCSEYIAGNFSQFLLAGCICEEAYKVLDDRNVEPVASLMHGKRDRAMCEFNGEFTLGEIKILKDICRKVANNGSAGLGFDDMAAMIVLYRNAPNNLPFALRGTIGQDPFKGILPRTTDLVSEAQALAARNVIPAPGSRAKADKKGQAG